MKLIALIVLFIILNDGRLSKRISLDAEEPVC